MLHQADEAPGGGIGGQRLVVSAAGPLAQLALAAAIVLALRVAGYSVPFPIDAIAEPLGLYEGRRIGSLQAFAFTMFMLSVNIYWPLLNLLPVPPLDGGQIVREGMLAMGVADAHKIAALLGVAVGALVAYWGYTRGQPFLGIMFAMLAVSCWQSLSAGGPRWR